VTPGGRISAAIEILDDIIAGAPAERALTRWARASRFAGSKDRAAVRDHVFDVLRKRRSCLWLSGQAHETGRALMIGLLAGEGADAGAAFSGEGHGPARLSDAEVAALRPDISQAPAAVRADVPAQIEDLLYRELGEGCDRAMQAQRSRAPVDLRVNTLKADLTTAQRLLAVESIETVAIDGVPTGLRIRTNPRKLAQCRAYLYGFVELQDAASQFVSRAVQVKPGQRVLDLCAGGGGKTLALGAQMAGEGYLAAYDINPRRMKDLPTRAARAGLQVEVLDTADLDRQIGTYDVVLVDAPCSGSGAWRRNPDAKWRLTQEDLHRLTATQDDVLRRAAELVHDAGKVVYTTCSILPCENAAPVATFLSTRENFGVQDEISLLPGEVGDGFYFCQLAHCPKS